MKTSLSLYSSGRCSGQAYDLRSMTRWWFDRATIMHKLSDTHATYCQRSWHRHWWAAWYWRGWTK